MEKGYKFYKLPPVNNAEIDTYKEALDYAINEKDIQNIAITGPYCSGKSSIVKTYAQITNKKFKYISLASFCDNADTDNTKASQNNGDGDAELELAIKHKRRYEIEEIKHKHRYEIEEKIINALVQQLDINDVPFSKFKIKNVNKFGLFCMSIGVFIIFLFILLILLLKYSENDLNLITPIITYGVITAIVIAIFMYNISKWLLRGNQVKKISTKFVDFSVQEDMGSFFDRNLDEILYLVTNAKCDGFVFEDIDRIQSERKYIFEELREICMLANERNKTLKNEKIIKFFYLAADDIFEVKDRVKFFDYIMPVVPYVDASNSYDILHERLASICEPNEIDDLFIRQVSIYIEDLRVINNIINEYQIYRSKLNNTKRDLNGLLAMIIYKNTHPQDFAKLQYDSGIVYDFFAQKKDIVDEKISAVDDNRNDSDVKKYAYGIKSQKLYQLLEKEAYDKVFEKIQNDTNNLYYNKLLVYLLEKGFINEDNYRDNMSYFRPGGISERDKNFLIAINESRALDYDYDIDNPASICKYLDEGSFQHESTCNYKLIDYIIYDNKNTFISAFISQLEEADNIDFVYSYYIYTEYKDIFVYKLTEKWSDVIKKILLNDKFTANLQTLQDIILRFLSVFTNNEVLTTQNDNNCINDFLNDYASSIDCKKDKTSNLVKGFETIGMKFNCLSKQINNVQLMDELYARNMYKLNIANIKEILSIKYGIVDNGNHLLSNVYQNKEEYLYDYVVENLDYVVDTIIRSYEVIDDNESTSTDIINSSLIDDQLRNKYISKLSVPISDIGKVDSLYYASLLDNNAIIPSFSNIIGYYKKHQYKGPFSQYINQHWNEIDFTDNSIDNNDTSSFWTGSQANDDLCEDAYEKICKSIGERINSLKSNGLSEKKIDILIKTKLLVMNVENLKLLRVHYKNSISEFAGQNIETYLTLINSAELTVDEVTGLLNNPNVNAESKIKLLKIYNKPIAVTNNEFEDEVIVYILKNLYDKKDNEYLFYNYSQFNDEIKKEIYSFASKNIQFIIDIAPNTDSILLQDLFEDPNIEYNNKIMITEKLIDNVDDTLLEKLMYAIDKKYAAFIFSSQKHHFRKIVNTSEDRQLLDLLVSKKRIESYTIEDEMIQINQKNKT